MMERKLNIARGIRFGQSWQQQSWVALAIFTSGLVVKCCILVLHPEQQSVMCQTLLVRYRLYSFGSTACTEHCAVCQIFEALFVLLLNLWFGSMQD